MKTLSLLILILSVMPSLVFAGEGSEWGKIIEVYVSADGTVMRVRFSEPIVNPDACEGEDFYIRELDESMGSDRFVKAVLAAHMADMKVDFWIEGCSKAKWWGKTRPVMFDIYIRR